MSRVPRRPERLRNNGKHWRLDTEVGGDELQRLRSIEAAAKALGPGAPIYYDGEHGEYRCRYCDGVAVLLDDITIDHKPGCKWVALEAALGQGQAGERGSGE